MLKLIRTIVFLLFVQVSFAQSPLLNIMVDETVVVPDTLGEEMLVNGDMELNSNWTAFGLEGGDVSEQSTTQVHGGAYSWHINVDATGEGITSDDFNVESGKTYWVQYWYYVVSGTGSIAPYFGRYSGLSTFGGESIGQWYYTKYLITASATGVDKLLIRSTGGAGAEFYLDDISVKELLP